MNDICMVDIMLLAMVTVQAQNSLYVFAFQEDQLPGTKAKPKVRKIDKPQGPKPDTPKLATPKACNSQR